jgi:CRISPR system Cascade subunit CasC
VAAPNFVNFHVLISHSPSCLNRDDMNMQKTAMFGGVNRVRISSQSLKRSMRTSDYYAQAMGGASIRTRELGGLVAGLRERLKDRFDGEVVGKAVEWMSGKEGIASGVEADAVAPWSIEEVAYVCDLIKANGHDAERLRKQVEKDARPFREAMSKAVDIALSGRMATSGLMKSLPVDGALAVAHAITTHAVEPQDVDWFTAVDDLKEDAGESGAGHLDTQQFSAGVFYRYASLNLRQLQVNLGLLTGMDAEETTVSRRRAFEIARHVLHMLATVVPSAKQQSFAAHNLADFAIVGFGEQPISLANAFERPVRRDQDGGFLKPSIHSLASYWERIDKAYSLGDKVRAFSTVDEVSLGGRAAFASLADIEQWIVSGGTA